MILLDSVSLHLYTFVNDPERLFRMDSVWRGTPMARLLRDAKLDTRTARLRLTPRGEPYWRTMEEGRAVG